MTDRMQQRNCAYCNRVYECGIRNVMVCAAGSEISRTRRTVRDMERTTQAHCFNVHSKAPSESVRMWTSATIEDNARKFSSSAVL